MEEGEEMLETVEREQNDASDASDASDAVLPFQWAAIDRWFDIVRRPLVRIQMIVTIDSIIINFNLILILLILILLLGGRRSLHEI